MVTATDISVEQTARAVGHITKQKAGVCCQVMKGMFIRVDVLRSLLLVAYQPRLE